MQNFNLVNKKTPIRISEVAKKELCEKWKISGLDKGSFCKEHNLSRSALYNWCKKFGIPFCEKSSSFVPVKVSSKTSISNFELNSPVEVFLPNQTMIRVKLPHARLVSFIQELTHAVTTIR